MWKKRTEERSPLKDRPLRNPSQPVEGARQALLVKTIRAVVSRAIGVLFSMSVAAQGVIAPDQSTSVIEPPMEPTMARKCTRRPKLRLQFRPATASGAAPRMTSIASGIDQIG